MPPLICPAPPGCDADATELKRLGNTVFDLLKQLSLSPPGEAHAFAYATCKAAFGVLPIAEGPNKLSDDEVRALIPVVKAARASLVLMGAVLAKRG